MDPIVSPGTASQHSHVILGGSNFGLTIKGDQLLGSACTTATINNDKSNYWVPTLWFRSPDNGTFYQVPSYYTNVWYHFDRSNDRIVAFPPGLKIVSGDAFKRTAPATPGIQLDPSKGPIQPVRFDCQRQGAPSHERPGFPLFHCDAFAAPLSYEIHLPSCYNPAAGLDNYRENMAFTSMTADGKHDCPAGWTHVPTLSYIFYFDTMRFAGLWTPDGKTQPFVLANGDRTGYSLHGDFVSGWDTATLQAIIDNCDTLAMGMEACPTLIGGVTPDPDKCKIPPAVPDPDGGRWLEALPGNNPLWDRS